MPAEKKGPEEDCLNSLEETVREALKLQDASFSNLMVNPSSYRETYSVTVDYMSGLSPSQAFRIVCTFDLTARSAQHSGKLPARLEYATIERVLTALECAAMAVGIQKFMIPDEGPKGKNEDVARELRHEPLSPQERVFWAHRGYQWASYQPGGGTSPLLANGYWVKQLSAPR